jgi:purine-binding chemotaxis protein CheW
MSPDIRQIVLFTLDAETYGVDILRVQEIVNAGPITPVPATPKYVLGLTNIRGRTIPLIDVRQRLALKEDRKDRAQFLILNSDAGDVGLVIDAVTEVWRVDPESVNADANSNFKPDLIDGVLDCNGRRAGILNLERVLGNVQ